MKSLYEIQVSCFMSCCNIKRVLPFLKYEALSSHLSLPCVELGFLLALNFPLVSQDDETALLEQALAMSMAEAAAAAAAGSAIADIPMAESGGDDQDLAFGMLDKGSVVPLCCFVRCTLDL